MRKRLLILIKNVVVVLDVFFTLGYKVLCVLVAFSHFLSFFD